MTGPRSAPQHDNDAVSEHLATSWGMARSRLKPSTSPDQDGVAVPAQGGTADVVCQAALARLEEALRARGLAVVVSGQVLCARNLQADPPGDQAGAQALAPGLSQSVLCRPDEQGRPWLWWVWSCDRGPGAADPDEGVERLCAASDIAYAADRIAHVIAVPAGEDA